MKKNETSRDFVHLVSRILSKLIHITSEVKSAVIEKYLAFFASLAELFQG